MCKGLEIGRPKGERGLPGDLILTSDITIFVSAWLRIFYFVFFIVHEVRETVQTGNRTASDAVEPPTIAKNPLLCGVLVVYIKFW